MPWVKVTRDPERYEMCLAQARKIGPITDARKVYDLLHGALSREDQEVFLVVMCDVRGQIRGVSEVARGQRSMVGVGVTDVMRIVSAVRITDTVLLTGGEMFLVVHNHPSGDSTPSQADRDLTKTIQKAVAPYGSELTFVDHVVIGSGNFYSILEGKKYKA